MKYLFFFVILLFSQVVYGQQQNHDLIVTTTGDSLFCKIIDVSPSRIQFRFDQSGSVITIRRDETVSHTYNYRPSSGTQTLSDRPKTESLSRTRGLNIAVSSGVNTFGTISVGDIDKGGAFVIGTDVAYFFNSYLGAGLKLNVSTCDIKLSEYFLSSDRLMFIGPALYGRFEKGKLVFGANVSVGGLNWNLSEVRIGDVSFEEESATSVSVFLSAGVHYMITRTFSFGVNVQSLLGSIKTDNYERTPAPLGVAFEVNYRF